MYISPSHLIPCTEQILLAYGLPKETVTAIMMLYSNTNVKVRSTDGVTDFFDIAAGETLASYVLIININYIVRMSRDLIKENGFTLKKQKGDDTPQKQLCTLTMQKTKSYRRLQLPKPNSSCIIWSRQQVALAST